MTQPEPTRAQPEPPRARGFRVTRAGVTHAGGWVGGWGGGGGGAERAPGQEPAGLTGEAVSNPLRHGLS